MKSELYNSIPRSEWERLVDEWIFNELHRHIIKRCLLDGKTYEQIAEEVDMSARHMARIIPELKKQLFKHLS
jgi:DNA-directed RNA polymerase specialized sigma subunit